jgi:hypothetical protein
MSIEIECCVECCFMAWDKHKEHFFCARTMDRPVVLPTKSVCEHGIKKIYRRKEVKPWIEMECLPSL